MTTKITVKNTGKRNEGIRTAEGPMVWILPGQQRTISVNDDRVAAVRRIDELKVEVHGKPAPAVGDAAKPAKAKQGAKAPTPVSDEIKQLRADYVTEVGKQPFTGWNAEQLRERIAKAKEAAPAATE